MTETESAPERAGAPLAGAGAPELALLAVAAGSIDVLAFAGLGGVLPSAMTGNTALLGLALGRGRLGDAELALLAFGGFVLGAAAASIGLDLAREHITARLTGIVLLVAEALLLVAFAVGWHVAAQPIHGPWRDGLILLAAGSMGIQGVVARAEGGPGISTIVFTSTLASIVTAVTRAAVRKPHRLGPVTQRQMATFASYLVGAVLGGLAFWSGFGAIADLPAAAVLSALAYHFRPQRHGVRRPG